MLLSIETFYKKVMMKNFDEIADILLNIKEKKELTQFFSELFTKTELSMLHKRWCILKMLNSGQTQRKIAKELNVSLCNVTRGAKILKDKSTVTAKFLMEGKNEQNGNN